MVGVWHGQERSSMSAMTKFLAVLCIQVLVLSHKVSEHKIRAKIFPY